MKTSHIFDTYAKISKGRTLHFDVALDDQNVDKVLARVQIWLKSISEEQAVVTQKNFIFYHSAEVSVEFRKQIDERSYAIDKLEGCPDFYFKF